MGNEKSTLKIGGRLYEGEIRRETVFFVWCGPLRDVEKPYNGPLPAACWPKSCVDRGGRS